MLNKITKAYSEKHYTWRQKKCQNDWDKLKKIKEEKSLRQFQQAYDKYMQTLNKRIPKKTPSKKINSFFSVVSPSASSLAQSSPSYAFITKTPPQNRKRRQCIPSPNNSIDTPSPSKPSNPKKARRTSIALDAPKNERAKPAQDKLTTKITLKEIEVEATTKALTFMGDPVERELLNQNLRKQTKEPVAC